MSETTATTNVSKSVTVKQEVIGPIQPVNNDQLKFPTWGLLGFLVVFFFVLKAFIYIKDPKKHGK